MVDDHFRQLAKKAEALSAMDEFYQRAYAMISSPAAREAFDITQESDKTKNLYGQNEAGMRFLLARRLIVLNVDSPLERTARQILRSGSEWI